MRLEKDEIQDALAHGAWGNYMAIHFLEWLSGNRVINSPFDIGVMPEDLPRLLVQAKAYELECAKLHAKYLAKWKEIKEVEAL